MIHPSLFEAFGFKPPNKAAFAAFSKATGLSEATLKWMDDRRKLPPNRTIRDACAALGLDSAQVKNALGIFDKEARENAPEDKQESKRSGQKPPHPAHCTALGTLYRGDCLNVMSSMSSESVDVVFADPPFNLGKAYPSGMDDSLRDEEYYEWCLEWLDESIRLLKPGGSMFVYNLPRWNIAYGRFISERLTFRHSIAVDMKYTLPISGRLYPSHYSLLYLVKGDKPRVFHPDRLATETCPKCFGDLKDYGGYKDKMNPRGVSLTDVWTDIPPVRHARHKKRQGSNELSIKLLDRVIELSSDTGDIIFDPFGGSGTTYLVAELKERRWIGCEIGPVDGIISRLEDSEGEAEVLRTHRSNLNALHPPHIAGQRVKRGLWVAETFRNRRNAHQPVLELE